MSGRRTGSPVKAAAQPVPTPTSTRRLHPARSALELARKRNLEEPELFDSDDFKPTPRARQAARRVADSVVPAEHRLDKDDMEWNPASEEVVSSPTRKTPRRGPNKKSPRVTPVPPAPAATVTITTTPTVEAEEEHKAAEAEETDETEKLAAYELTADQEEESALADTTAEVTGEAEVEGEGGAAEGGEGDDKKPDRRRSPYSNWVSGQGAICDTRTESVYLEVVAGVGPGDGRKKSRNCRICNEALYGYARGVREFLSIHCDSYSED